MDTSNNTTAELAELATQEVYLNYVFNIANVSGTTLLFYVVLLRSSQEREHIWLKSFSLPSLLYVFARYGTLVQQGFDLWLNFLALGTTCDVFADVGNAMDAISYIGVQVLLIARTYALCGGNKFIATALALSSIASFVLNVFNIILFNGCLTNFSAEDSLITLSINILTIITDSIVFAVCMWKVWSTWKLKREVGMQGAGSDLVSILLKQSILRCCFVVVITVGQTILIQISSAPIVSTLTVFQNVLSSILVADFTLDLRERNSAKIEASDIKLPALQIQSVLQYVHQSFMVEAGTPETEPEQPVGEESGPADSEEV